MSLHARSATLAPPSAQLRALGGVTIGQTRPDFDARLRSAGWAELRRAPLEIFQINLGKLCNMTCRHCHVDAGPDRTDEVMSRETIDACLRALDRTSAHTVDLTGGAPELNPHFRDLVDEAVARKKHVIDRCNLTILLTSRGQDLPAWLSARGVEVVCSLPHSGRRNTDHQRGEGTFDKSIEAMRRLNEAGYGRGDPDRILTLMANAGGAFLLKNAAEQEAEWKSTLKRRYGVTFDRRIVLNNMPIARFLEWLLETESLNAYVETLVGAFNPATIAQLMCRNTLSISWDGFIYDCDFNQMLDMKVYGPGPNQPQHIEDFDPEVFAARPIRTAVHCFGCTAGAGSSCGGATA
ncbi:MAG: arsenosugar biosynthesis radical SAM protein ArsS [Deltaproteobacteria bacterium]|nr:arsenosugar biosynthesis radical SAM protein ArsS [Deltaproteobacteria bacterium]